MRSLKAVLSLCIVVSLFVFAGCVVEDGVVVPVKKTTNTINLSGQWTFQTDPEDVGILQSWFNKELGGTINLPGSMAENGLGDDVDINTKWNGWTLESDPIGFAGEKYDKYRSAENFKFPFWLTPVKYYAGAAWYQKKIDVPTEWAKKNVVLYLERAHWETQVWVNGEYVGKQNSLATQHEYNLGGIGAGEHTVTIFVDNRVKVPVGVSAHSISDHTQTNWNGIIGDIELRAVDSVVIDDIQVYPDVAKKQIKVIATIKGPAGIDIRSNLELTAESFNTSKKHWPAKKVVPFSIENGKGHIETILSLGENALLWDEFSPNMYRLNATIDNYGFKAEKTVDFGMRQIGTDGTNITINGNKRILRGTLECCIFPLTGYPDMSVDGWLRIMRIAKSHGLNHLRFHSWCPPKAAFRAADIEGFFLQVECSAWCNFDEKSKTDKSVEQFVYAEGDRILKEYGNHPSFVLMAYGNEPGGKTSNKILGKMVDYWKAKDNRRFYTSGAGWPILEENDFHCDYKPRIQLWGAGLTSRINAKPPETVTDYSNYINKYKVPVVSHEIGQWCVYPNFEEIKKYTGVTRAKNFEIFQDWLIESGMGKQAEDFLYASGKLQTLCYKEDIESALRTKGFGGFQLLDLHDFPGQGTALVGVLDAFWDEKGYTNPQEYHEFSCETVPLARMSKRVFTENEIFKADIEVAHYGAGPIEKAKINWTVTDDRGSTLGTGLWSKKEIPLGNIELGTVELDLDNVIAPSKLTLRVSIKDTEYANQWNFWVYPEKAVTETPTDVLVVDRLNDEAIATLEKGGKVMLLANPEMVKGDENGPVPAGFSSIFWNTGYTRGQQPHTLGVLCDPGHKGLREFVTDYHSDWQWWYIITKSRSMILNDLPKELTPIVQIVDDWYTSRKLGLVFEAKVGNGKLLVCSIDLKRDIDSRPVAKQMLVSLNKYVGGEGFNPKVSVSAEKIKSLFIKPSAWN